MGCNVLTKTLLLICACSVVGYLAPVAWFFDLFNHYRPQAAAAALLLLAPALLKYKTKALILVLTVLGLNLPPMLLALKAFPVASPYAAAVSKPEVTILAANVLTSNRHYADLLTTIAAQQPDVVVLTEVDAAWCEAMAALKAEYTYAITIPRPDNFGMAIYSKQSFDGHNYPAGRYALPMIAAEFDGFVLLAAHPLPPMSADNVHDLRDYLADVATHIRGSAKPLVLAGDLNATLWGDTMRPLQGLGLQRTNETPFAWTWPSIAPPLAIQIDHIFVRGMGVGAFSVLPGIGSDHFPIMARLVLQ